MSVTANQMQALSRPAALSRAGYVFLTVFLLIVLEGAVRKWVFSSVTLPLILLRDLLAVGLIMYAWKGGHFRRQKKITAIMLAWSALVLAWALFQLVAGASAPVVLIIGLRFWLLYTWFAIAAASTMNEADYRASIIMAGWLMILMAPLAILQHYSPPGAFINTQVDGDGTEEGIFVAVVGVVRTTGTFSFTAGYSFFMTLIGPIVFGILGARKSTTRQLLFAVAVFLAFMSSALVSGSRTTVISSSLMFAAYLMGRLLFSKVRNKPAALVAVVAALAMTAVFAYIFREAIDVTQTRFEQASAAEDFTGRILTIIFGEPTVYEFMTWLGYGVGFGSNLATFVRTGGADVFALAESEGGRILMEGGLLGIVYVLLKMIAVVVGFLKSLRISSITNSSFPMLVWLTVGIAAITWTSIGQLTANGLLGVVLTFAFLLFRYPRLEIFPQRASRT